MMSEESWLISMIKELNEVNADSMKILKEVTYEGKKYEFDVRVIRMADGKRGSRCKY